MEKPLSQLTLEELWALFPIILRAHEPCWLDWYAAEAARLSPVLPAGTRLHHIGSTAVAGIWAKPIVDILVETPPRDMDAAHEAVSRCGYLCMHTEPTRRDYNRGYTPKGFDRQVFHLHLRRPGDCDELYFRDYLIAHPDIAKDYEALKLSLWKRFEHDRDGYTDAKGAFVRRWTQAAKQEYAGRYES